MNQLFQLLVKIREQGAGNREQGEEFGLPPSAISRQPSAVSRQPLTKSSRYANSRQLILLKSTDCATLMLREQ